MSFDLEEEALLRSTAQRNAASIFLARQRAEDEIQRIKEALEHKTQELARACSMMRATLESTTDGILVIDDAGRVIDYNESFVRMWRVPRELLDQHLHVLMEHCAAQSATPDQFRTRIAEIEATSPAESTDLLELIDERRFERFSRTLSVGGRKLGRVWSFRDVTAQNRAAADLREQRELLQVTLASIGDAVITTDRDGRVTFLNPVAEALTGWALHEAAGQPLQCILQLVDEHSRKVTSDPLRRLLLDREEPDSTDTDVVLVSRDGTEIPIDKSIAPIRHEGGRISGFVIVFHDVTQRRQADNALRQSRERLEAALKAASTGTFRWDASRNAFEGDENTDRLFGVLPGESIRTLEDLIARVHPNHRERVAQHFRVAAHVSAELDVEFQVVLPDGDLRWLYCRGRVAPDPGGRPPYLAGACVDTTERRRFEEARLRLAALVESSEDAIIGKTLDGIITSWNTGAERMFGHKAADVLGKSITLLVPEDRLDEENEILRKLRDGERIQSYETVRVRNDGSLRDIALTVSPIRNATGEIIGASTIARDVTHRKQTEAALREEYNITEQLNEVAKSLSTELDFDRIARVITDVGRRITHGQFAAFYRDGDAETGILHTLSGGTRDELRELGVPEPARFFELLRASGGILRIDDVRRDGRFEFRLSEDAGVPPVLSCLAVAVTSRAGESLGGLLVGHSEVGAFSARDERMIVAMAAQAAAAMETARLYAAQQQARAAAEQASNAKDLFLAALSHELRTPLTPAMAILSSLCQDPTLPPDLMDDLQRVRRNVELEARLIDDLLDLTRITHGKLELHRVRVQVAQVVDDVFDTCRQEIEAKNLTVIRDLEEPHRVIVVDSARITQILWNLLKNAIKFTPSGGTITIRSRLQTTEQGQQLAIEVIDTGIGIEPGRIPKLFEAFEQGDREITRQFGGLGLGLRISQAIAEMHNGTLTGHSEGKDRGSTFTLTLPLTTEEVSGHGARDPMDAGRPAIKPKYASEGRPPKILLVEDHADSARALAALLRRRGFDVVLASDMASALAASTNQPIDLVISDLGLPDGSGYDLMRRLRERHPVPGVALSGYGMEQDVQKSYDAGFAEHLLKPVQASRLHAVLDRLLPALTPKDWSGTREFS